MCLLIASTYRPHPQPILQLPTLYYFCPATTNTLHIWLSTVNSPPTITYSIKYSSITTPNWLPSILTTFTLSGYFIALIFIMTTSFIAIVLVSIIRLTIIVTIFIVVIISISLVVINYLIYTASFTCLFLILFISIHSGLIKVSISIQSTSILHWLVSIFIAINWLISIFIVINWLIFIFILIDCLFVICWYWLSYLQFIMMQ